MFGEPCASLPSTELKTSAQCSAKVRWERRVTWELGDDIQGVHQDIQGGQPQPLGISMKNGKADLNDSYINV